MTEIYLVSVARTPVGSFNGSLASLSAPQLGSIVIKEAIGRAKLEGKEIDEVFIGNVLTANVGQAPATQAMIAAGVSNTTPSTTINKVCASGMKAIILGAQTISLGQNNIVVCGGMESMSNVPYYLDNARNGYRMGHKEMIDGMIKDGLWDPYNNIHMGNCGEICAKANYFTREMMDEYTISTFTKAQNAYKNGLFNDEIVPTVGSAGTPVTEDEQYKKAKFDKIPTLKPAFTKDGSITAANSSPLSDGATAVVLMSGDEVKRRGLKPIAKIIGYGDAAQTPELFATSPSLAIPKALKMAGLTIDQVDAFEINEAFSVVALANAKILNVSIEKVNLWGGAVALGHALGNSGARITVTLSSILKANGFRYGVAAICNGGGGASAIVLENCL